MTAPDVKIIQQPPKIEVNIPPQVPPSFYVTVPEQAAPVVQVTVEKPDPAIVNVQVPEVNVEVKVPEQAAPTVQVTIPEPIKQEAPVIEFNPVINVPETNVVVNNEVKVPSGTEKIIVTRDSQGRIAEATKVTSN